MKYFNLDVELDEENRWVHDGRLTPAEKSRLDWLFHFSCIMPRAGLGPFHGREGIRVILINSGGCEDHRVLCSGWDGDTLDSPVIRKAISDFPFTDHDSPVPGPSWMIEASWKGYYGMAVWRSLSNPTLRSIIGKYGPLAVPGENPVFQKLDRFK